jgi:hypothetical protein
LLPDDFGSGLSINWLGMSIEDKLALVISHKSDMEIAAEEAKARVAQEQAAEQARQEELARLASVPVRSDSNVSPGSNQDGGNDSSGDNYTGEWRSVVVPKEQEMADGRWGPGQGQALTNILDNENYSRDPYLVGCAYGIAQKIDGWDDSYICGDVESQLRWVMNYIDSRYGNAINAWEFKRTHGWY